MPRRGDVGKEGAAARAAPRALVRELARLTHELREHVARALDEPASGPRDATTEEPVADLVAQMITCGLFAARGRAGGGRALERLDPHLPAIGARRAALERDPRVMRGVDAIAEAVAASPLDEEGDAYFYEAFLAAYDPEQRGGRGVYYTPRPIVDYLVQSVDGLLGTAFDVPEGLASPRAIVVDPAAGTGLFLQAVIARIHARIAATGPSWPAYVARHLLPRIVGLELLAAPQVTAQLRLAAQLGASGVDLRGMPPIGLHRRDALERGALPALDGERAPIPVVLGNPPYAGHSRNRGEWITELTREYREGLPELQRPGQGKWLQDDYIKFMRLAQWWIDRAGRGIVAYITNHAWLSNPTFRGMRRSLLATFDEIRVLDLHGSGLRRERTPAGERDENVFDIQQGVAIALLVRRGDRGEARTRSVSHAELWGSRADKHAFLAAHDVRTTEWRAVTPAAPEFLFAPQPPQALCDEYAAWWSVADIFGGDPAPGVLTTQDELAISWTAEEMVDKVERLLATRSEAEARALWRLCSQGQWSYARAKAELADGAWRRRVVPILYRPFDLRHTVYDRNIAVHRRERASSQILGGDNLVLLTTRQTKDAWGVLCTTHLPAHKSASRFDITFALPLWRFDAVRRTNLADAFVRALPGAPGPEDVFAYIYALLHAPSYRRRHADFLRGGFARVPATTSAALFAALREHGARLVDLHARGAGPAGDPPGFPVAGSDRVEELPRWREGQVWINRTQRFTGVPAEAWELSIGGYCPAAKWLADRRGRILSAADITHYPRMIGTLRETAAIMAAIDATIAAQGGWPLR